MLSSAVPELIAVMECNIPPQITSPVGICGHVFFLRACFAACPFCGVSNLCECKKWEHMGWEGFRALEDVRTCFSGAVLLFG